MAGAPVLPRESRYEVIVEIASGGMGTVYVGRRSGAEGFQRLVAIKRSDASVLKDLDLRRALVREAELAAGIHHANVVAVIDVEQLPDELLLVLEYVEGGSLDALQRQTRELSADVVIRLILDAAAGLHAAHELGIVHRDVSPHNILIGLDGVARITDFGIAHAVSSTTASVEEVRGKLGYLAPEYVDTGSFDRRSDVFALGVVLWEALAGRRLFKADGAVDMMRMTLTMTAPLLSSVSPSLGVAFDATLERALAKNPAERFQSALEMSEALEQAARGARLALSHRSVAACVEHGLGPSLEHRRALIRSAMTKTVVNARAAPPDSLVATRIDPPRPEPRSARDRVIAAGVGATCLAIFVAGIVRFVSSSGPVTIAAPVEMDAAALTPVPVTMPPPTVTLALPASASLPSASKSGSKKAKAEQVCSVEPPEWGRELGATAADCRIDEDGRMYWPRSLGTTVKRKAVKADDELAK